MKYVVLDLKKARDFLAEHYDPTMKDEYGWPCPECGEEIGQQHEDDLIL